LLTPKKKAPAANAPATSPAPAAPPKPVAPPAPAAPAPNAPVASTPSQPPENETYSQRLKRLQEQRPKTQSGG